MQPAISIIVPVYNVELYVAKCIQSIMEQTFDNFECLIIDDGSLDNSISIIKGTIQQDKRFRLFSQQNQGQGIARNLGLDHAQGEYVCFVDSDDYIDPDYLQKTYDHCRNDQADICSFNYQEIDGKYNPIRRATVFENKDIENKQLICDLLESQNHFRSPCMALYKRALFAGIKFPKGAFEDTPTIILLLLKNRNIRVRMIDDVLYFWVFRRGSTTRSMDIQKINDMLVMLKTIQKNLQLYDTKQEFTKEFLVFNMNTTIYFVSWIVRSNNYKYNTLYFIDNIDNTTYNHRITNSLFFRHRKINSKKWLFTHFLLLKKPLLIYLLWQLDQCSRKINFTKTKNVHS